MASEDVGLNQHIKPQLYDPLVRAALLWMFPRWIRPNHITVFRFFASPFVFWLFLEEQYKAGLIAFLLVALTDALDGTMARTRRQITVWGTTYDGVADKILIVGAVLILAVQHLSLWLVAAIIVLEAISTVGGLYYKWTKGVVHEALWWGKIKMNLHVIAVAILLLHVIWDKPVYLDISSWVFLVSLGFAVMNIAAHVQKERQNNTALCIK